MAELRVNIPFISLNVNKIISFSMKKQRFLDWITKQIEFYVLYLQQENSECLKNKRIDKHITGKCTQKVSGNCNLDWRLHVMQTQNLLNKMKKDILPLQ